MQLFMDAVSNHSFFKVFKYLKQLILSWHHPP